MVTTRRLARVFVDSIAWVTAAWLSTLLRFDGDLPQHMSTEIWKFALLAIVVSFTVSFTFSLYTGKYRNASLEEVLILGLTTAISASILFSARVLFQFSELPRSVPISASFLSLVIMLAIRVIANPRIIQPFKKRVIGEPTLIYGAGIAGRQLVEKMLSESNTYSPIGFLDDDKSLSNLMILGRKVLGNINDLEKIIHQFAPTILVIAISGIDSRKLLEIERVCRAYAVNLRIIPTAYEIVSGAVQLTDVEDISEEDLLGRKIFQTDSNSISEFLRDKRILVTGAGGSIGSEIARQVIRFNPKSLLLLDRDENALLKLQLSIDGTAMLTNESLILADLRDEDKVHKIFKREAPQIVFHAAALKHLTTLERFPDEAYKTNVLGTRNVLLAAAENGVETFVNISTDKAANPTSILGKSKLLTEKMTAGMNIPNSKFISVRFGNVIGSNGSFLHTFRQQIRNGGPVTITHPEVSRYFMTTSEAVQLVLQATVLGKNSETLILDMGEPVKILEIAKLMIAKSGRNILIKYTGLREGEKLEEVLISPDESIELSVHKSIMHTKVLPIRISELSNECEWFAK